MYWSASAAKVVSSLSLAFHSSSAFSAASWAPDAESYAEHRGFYGTYADVAGIDYATTWQGAADQLASVLGDDRERERRTAHSRTLSTRVHVHADGGNTDRVYRAIRAALDAATATRRSRHAETTTR